MSKSKKKLKSKIKVGVIFGGRSGEHEVSIVSAQSVMKALNRNKYEVIPIGVTKEGQWLSGDNAVKYLVSGLKKIPFKSILLPDPTERRIIQVNTESLKPLTTQNATKNIDVIFPLIHGTYGEDGTLQGMLELANLPYIGSGVLGSAVGMDKVIAKQLFLQARLPIGKFDWFTSKDFNAKQKDILHRLEKIMNYPMFTKPANLGSSVGIGKCHNRQELIQGIKIAARYDRKILVEEGISDIREIEVAVLGNDRPKASVPGEIISSNEFYDYDAKYIDGQSQAIIPAKLPNSVIKKLQFIAVQAFRTLDLAGMARVDFFVKKKSNTIFLNEVNTIPGFTSISMYPKLWQATGINYKKLLDILVDLALQRHREKNRLATSFKPKNDWFKE